MNAYIVFLGRETELCYAEIAAFLEAKGSKPPVKIGRIACFLETYNDDINELQEYLGGVIKIAQVQSRIDVKEAESKVFSAIQAFVDTIIANRPQRESSKITFSLSFIQAGKQHVLKNIGAKQISEALKDYLSQKQCISRFVLGGQIGLSSVQIKTQKILQEGFELMVITTEDAIYLCQTVAIQDYKSWQKRDYGRPESDPRRGMLPPKLARIMVNIAANLYKLSDKQSKTLYDPFCGEGTVLQEALLQGLTVSGSDVDPQAVAHTQKNLQWLQTTAGADQLGTVDRLFVADINANARHFAPGSIDLIVTEPDLGPPIRGGVNQNIARKIRETYTKRFRHLLTHAALVQPAGGILAVVVPFIHNSQFSQPLIEKNVLDSREKFGYTLLRGPFSYARPDAKIGRHIYFFRKVHS